MHQSLNLVSVPWIKLVDNKIVSLHAFFETEKAPELAGTPVQRLIVFRLLLAIAYQACPLEMEEDYEALTVEEMRFKVLKYLEAHQNQFDLFDAEHPFLQHPGLTAKHAKKFFPLAAFLPGVCHGNTTLLFASNVMPSDLSASDTVYALLQVVTFGMGGKKFEKDLVFAPSYIKKSASPSPALGRRGWLHTYALGNDIFESLRLNLFSEELFDHASLSFLKKRIGVAPWEKMPTKEVGEEACAYTSSLMGWLVPIARFCRITDQGLILTSGVEYPKIETGLCDLSVSTITTGTRAKAQFTALRAETKVAPWRQMQAILAFFNPAQKQSGCRGLQLVLSHRHKQMTAIWCAGVQVTEMSGEQYFSLGDDFVESVFKVRPEHLNETFLTKYAAQLEALDQVSNLLSVCVRNCYDSLNAKYQAQKMVNKAREIFWLKCASLGVHMVEAFAKGQSNHSLAAIWDIAELAYDKVCPKEGARQLMAYYRYCPRKR